MGLRLISGRFKRKAGKVRIGKALACAVPAMGVSSRARSAEGVAVAESPGERRSGDYPVVMRDCPGFGIFCVFCDVCTFVQRRGD